MGARVVVYVTQNSNILWNFHIKYWLHPFMHAGVAAIDKLAIFDILWFFPWPTATNDLINVLIWSPYFKLQRSAIHGK